MYSMKLIIFVLFILSWHCLFFGFMRHWLLIEIFSELTDILSLMTSWNWVWPCLNLWWVLHCLTKLSKFICSMVIETLYMRLASDDRHHLYNKILIMKTTKRVYMSFGCQIMDHSWISFQFSSVRFQISCF